MLEKIRQSAETSHLLDQDPRQDEKFLEQCKKIIDHQYNYFKTCGTFTNFSIDQIPSELKLLEDGARLYVPDLQKYEFFDTTKSIEQTKTESGLRQNLQKIYQVNSELPKIHYLQLEYPENITDSKIDYKSSDQLKNNFEQIKFLLTFLQKSKEWLKSNQAEIQNVRDRQQLFLIEQFNLMYFNNEFITEKEITQIINNAFSKIQQTECVQLKNIDAKIFEKNINNLSDAQGRLKEAIYSTTYQDDHFLSQETRSPVFFSYWLNGVKESLEQINWESLNNYILTLQKLMGLDQEQVVAKTKNIIAQEINLLIQRKIVIQTLKQEPITKIEEKFDIDIKTRTTKKASVRKTLEELHKNDPIGLKRARAKQNAPDFLKQDKARAEKDKAREEAKTEHQPARKLHQKTENYEMVFNSIDQERLKETKGRIETWEPELQNNKLFITNRADLSKTGFAPIKPQEPLRLIENLPLFSKDESVNYEKSIIHLPCVKGDQVCLPIPANYELLSIGWSTEDSPQLTYPVVVNFYPSENAYSFVNQQDGYVHYAIKKNKETVKAGQTEADNFLTNFQSAYDSMVIKNIIAQAMVYSDTEEKINYIVQEFAERRLNFIYGLGSDLLDELYNNLGQQKFYALTENIGIGHCQIFSAMVANIFRQAGIPARIVRGEISHNNAFKTIGHAKVEYFNEQTKIWQEFEATVIADNTSYLLKNRENLTEAEQQNFDKLSQFAVGEIDDFNQFENVCRQIKELVLQKLPTLEQKAKKLDEFVEKYTIIANQGLTGKTIQEIKENIYKLYKLGARYSSYEINFFDIKEPEEKYEKYKRHSAIDPMRICRDVIFKFLDEQLKTRRTADKIETDDIVDITDNLIQMSNSDRKWEAERASEDAINLFRNNNLDVSAGLNSSQLIEIIAGRYTTNKVFNSLDKTEDLKMIFALLKTSLNRQTQQSKIFHILFNFIGDKYPQDQILLTAKDEQEYQEMHKLIDGNKQVLKELVANAKSWLPLQELPPFWVEDQEWNNACNLLLKSPEPLLNPQEKEKLLYQVLKEDLDLIMSNLDRFFYSFRHNGLFDFKPDPVLANERQEIVSYLKQKFETDIKALLAESRDSIHSYILRPFLASVKDIDSFNAEQAALFIERSLFPDSVSQNFSQINDAILTVNVFFPELKIDDNLIEQWNQRFREDKNKYPMRELVYQFSFANEWELSVKPDDINETSYLWLNFFEFSLSLSNDVKKNILEEDVMGILTDLHQFCFKQSQKPTEEIYFNQRLLKQIFDSNKEAREKLRQSISEQKNDFLDTALKLFFKYASKEHQYYFRLVYLSQKDGKNIFQDIPAQIKDFYQKFPQDTIEKFFSDKQNNKRRIDASITYCKDEIFKKIENLTAPQEKEIENKNQWLKLAKAEFKFIHPFEAFKQLKPELFKLLEQTAPEQSGKLWQTKLDVLERTFRNHLNKLGEFINLNYKFAQAGENLADLRDYQIGDDIRAIDQKASARSNVYKIKQSFPEQEPKNNLFILNLDNLFSKQGKFEKYSKWGNILEDLYDKLFFLMKGLSRKKKKLEINMFFHGAEAIKLNLPFNKIPVKDHFDKIRETLLIVFAEINRYLPILQDEYEVAIKKNITPFLKSQTPNLRIIESTNVIGLDSDTAGLITLASKKHTAASRLADK